VLTEKQKEHSKLHKQNYHGRRRLRDYPTGIQKTYPPSWDEDLKESLPTTIEELFKTAACSADAAAHALNRLIIVVTRASAAQVLWVMSIPTMVAAAASSSAHPSS
jgi:hypothetical protein